MEFLLQSRRRSSARNVPATKSVEKQKFLQVRGGMDNFGNHKLQFDEIKIYSLYCKSQLKT